MERVHWTLYFMRFWNEHAHWPRMSLREARELVKRNWR